MDNKNIINLKGGRYYITNNERDAFMIESGKVMVYIIPLIKDEIGRRSFLYEADKGEVIPGLCYQDMEYCNWRFCLVAIDEAVIKIIENGSTKTLRENFAQRAKLRNYSIEGYNGSLVDQYRTNIVIEDGFILRNQYEHENTTLNILKLIFNSFYPSKVLMDGEPTKSPLYNAVNILCLNNNVSIAPFEKIKEACGDNFSIADIARLSHFSYREVVLEYGWQKNDSGAFLVFDREANPFVCIPKGTHSYLICDAESGTTQVVTKKIIESLLSKAYMIYRPLPINKIQTKDLMKYCIKGVKKADIAWLLLLTVATSLIGLLTPTISQSLYDKYIPLGEKSILFQFGSLMFSFMIANILFSIVKSLVNFRITSGMAYDIQSAIYDRTFNLSESFFRDFESADLAQRVMGAGTVVNTIASVIITSIISTIFVIVYLVRMSSYSWLLTLTGILMVIIYSVLYYFLAVFALKYKQKSIELDGKTNSIMSQFLRGISKLRIAGVEDRALYEYLKPYVELRNNESQYSNIVNLSSVLSMISSSIFSIVLYLIIVYGGQEISIGSFIAFNTVFGSFTAYIMQIVEGAVDIKNEMPAYRRLKPIFEAVPEFDDAKGLPGDITGTIEINNITFSYSDNSPTVLNNISLNIEPGEYIGIVGPSGCGKSTLMKLLLGFEKPTSGKIYYDNKDIENIDKRELRKKMGVVLQDGNLISGSIFENITITSPKATVDDVKKVIKAVGMEKDINEMPMGLHTVLSEECGNISGGQQQRILIARAIVSNPKILFFDEATSALDNITQNMVCETLEKMESTRIVIAHRLSTIIKCDRIIVMDNGKIVEQGTYDELMENQGLFYQLAVRQSA